MITLTRRKPEITCYLADDSFGSILMFALGHCTRQYVDEICNSNTNTTFTLCLAPDRRRIRRNVVTSITMLTDDDARQ